jgi:magnesium transporter
VPPPGPSTRTVADETLTDVPQLAAGMSAAEARLALGLEAYSSASDIAVLADRRLVGVVPVERLLPAADDTTLGELAEPSAVVAAGGDLEVATRAAARAGRRTLAVIDDRSRFLGFIPSERLLHILEREHEVDLARLGGFLSRASVVRTASEEAVGRRLWHRLPWLALGLLGAMASAAIVGSFEEELQKELLLAFFVPAVVYMADAVGTQTETVVIRAMSIGIPVRAMVVRELLTGLIIGALIGLAFFPFAAMIWGNAQVAATVGISLLVSCTVATLVAMALPYLLARLGRDPAFGSGPLATVVQDLLSILAYFGTAALIVF